MTYIFSGRVGYLLFITVLLFFSFAAKAQNKSNTSDLSPVVVRDASNNTFLSPIVRQDTGKNGTKHLTLQQCVDYALLHQPALNRSLVNVDITRTTNAINLSALLPQISASGALTHNIQRNQNVNNSNFAGFANTFVPGLAVTQNIFTPSLLYASKTASLYLKQAQQVTDSTKIFLVSAISKSFYNVLLTLEQINVLKEDTARLGKNVRDTYHQYQGGIVDETNYEEAQITLNNSRAQLKQATENVVPQYASLKLLMGYPPEQQFNVNFDTLQMIKGIYIDTAQLLQYEKRIEFQQLKTNKSLQKELINYYRTSFIPTVSAFFNYRLNFQNNTLPDIFSSSYPTSLVGLSFSVPIFTGFSRLNNLKKARLQYELLDWDETGLKLVIYREYTVALANYKSNFYNLKLLEQNVSLAKRVYFVVNLQYKQGIVPYLNVITAESNLITSEINYLNALFQVLSSKIDLQKVIGNISY